MTETTATEPTRHRHRRAAAEHGHHRVTFLELFFDLVFVFAVTQLSHALIHHPTPVGLLEVTILAMAVWWVWIYTSWATNWADPDKPAVRCMMFALMLAGLILSMAIPKAFEGRALIFALAYVAMQAGRTGFMVAVMAEYSPAARLNMLRILYWFLASGALWIAGALAGGAAQIVLWIAAVALEYAGPALRFFVPGMGYSKVDEWTIEPAHFAERCGLFVIIALGESILVSSTTFAAAEWTGAAAAAFFAAFVAVAAMWAIYFNIGQERGAIAMKSAAQVGAVGRAYTYVHLFIVGGIIFTAVADEFVLAHPTGTIDGKTLASLIGGPFAYVLGCTLFKRATAGWYPLSHLAGMVFLGLLIPAASVMQPWQMTLATSLVLVVVAVWERVSLGPDGVSKIGHPSQRNGAA